MSRRMSCVLLAGLVFAIGCGRKEAALTPEQARAKGDALVKKMSDSLAAAKVFSYSTDEIRERVRRNGEKVEEKFQRKVIVRRQPDAIAFTGTQGGGWYDGQSLTLYSDKDKVWARGPMPSTLDAAIDYLSAEYALQLPSADLLYSNPYEALITKTTTGGWVNVENVGTRACDHLSYHEADLDWELWLAQDERAGPCKIQITYKKQPGQPKATVIFSDFNPAPSITDTTFTPAVPEGYNRIRIMRHASQVEEPAPGPTPPAGTAAPAAQPR